MGNRAHRTQISDFIQEKAGFSGVVAYAFLRQKSIRALALASRNGTRYAQTPKPAEE